MVNERKALKKRCCHRRRHGMNHHVGDESSATNKHTQKRNEEMKERRTSCANERVTQRFSAPRWRLLWFMRKL